MIVSQQPPPQPVFDILVFIHYQYPIYYWSIEHEIALSKSIYKILLFRSIIYDAEQALRPYLVMMCFWIFKIIWWYSLFIVMCDPSNHLHDLTIILNHLLWASSANQMSLDESCFINLLSQYHSIFPRHTSSLIECFMIYMHSCDWMYKRSRPKLHESFTNAPLFMVTQIQIPWADAVCTLTWDHSAS